MIRVFSFSTGLGLAMTLVAVRANAQGVPPAPSAAAPAAPAPQAAPAAAPPAPAPPAYGPPPQGEPPPGWGQPAYQWRAQPMEMKYIEGRPIPAGYHVETRARKGLVVSGPIIFGVPYLLSMSVAASSKYEPDRWLYAPVVGPFVNLASRNDECNPNGSSGSTSTTYTCTSDSSTRFFLMLDGLMQTAGATMLILGLALPQTLLVRDDAPYTGKNGSHFAWTVSPYTMGRQGSGFAVTGIF